MGSVDTSNNSFFFTSPTDLKMTEQMPLELLHTSENSRFEIWRFDKNGKFRVLKALKKEYRGDSLCEDMLKKEFEISYVLDHPNICEAYSYFRHPELGMCVEMEWIDGVTLDEYMSVWGKSFKEQKRVILELCSALSYIHSKQIVHRDLKPSNVLITHNGHNVKLIDFGLADSNSHRYLKEGAGTSLYASPEQINGGVQDCRCDIYSMGVILSEFPSSGRFGPVTRRCLRLDPGKRYSSVEELGRAVSSCHLLRYAVPSVLLLASLTALGLYFARLAYDEPIDVESIDEVFNEATKMMMEGSETGSFPED